MGGGDDGLGWNQAFWVPLGPLLLRSTFNHPGTYDVCMVLRSAVFKFDVSMEKPPFGAIQHTSI